MSNCQQCKTQLLDQAKFCHQCGTKVSNGKASPCPSCNTINPAGTSNCLQCGANMAAPAKRMGDKYKTTYPLFFKDTNSLPAQIRTHFLKALQRLVQKEYPDTQFNDYVNIFHESVFNEFFDQKAYLLAEATYTIHAKQLPTQAMDIDILLNSHFERLLNQFVMQHCQELTGEAMPNAVALYDIQSNGSISEQQLVHDFFDLEEQNEKYITDIEAMAPMKLQNAQDSFLFAQPDETTYLIYDQTIYGSCREGFALTDKGMYWKSHFKQAHQVQFADLKILEKQEQGLNINNLLFDINKEVNLKVLMYLRRKAEF